MPEVDLLERLKQERLERDKKRREEMAKFEAEMNARKEARKAERQTLREKEQQSEKLMNEMTKKTIQESLKKAEIKSMEDDLKNKEFQTRQKDLHVKLDGDRELFNSRQQRLKEMELKRKRMKIPPRAKRYVVHPAEFYGIDFSFAAHIDQRQKEIYELGRKREEEYLQNPEKMKQLMNAGNAIIKALFETASIEKDSVRDLLRKKRFTGSLSTVYENQVFSNEEESEVNTTMAKSHDDFLASLNNLSDPITLDASTDNLSQKTKKKWNQMLPKHNVDYSEMFPSNLGLKEEIIVFRIQELKPVRVPNNDKVGYLSRGDCYIVLHTFEDEKTSMLQSKIYQWVGEQASMDKKACSAIFSVGLRNLLNIDTDVVRVSSTERSTEFENIFAAFDRDFVVVDETKATDSGLFTVKEREYPLLVYQVSTRKINQKTSKEDQDDRKRKVGGDTALQLVEANPRQFKSHNVYLIDNGLTIYQWNGSNAGLTDKMKCRLFAQTIVTSERPPGKAKFVEMNQGEELEEFWQIFQDVDLEAEIDDQEEIEGSDQNETGDDDYYKCVYIFQDDTVDISMDIDRVDLEKYLKYSSSSQHGLPSASMLSETTCAVLDCKNEIYFWVGRKSSSELRDFSQQLLIDRIFPQLQRPEFVSTSKVVQGVEPEAFKIRFRNWVNRASIDFSESKPTFARLGSDPENGNSNEASKIRVDIKSIYSPAWNGKNTSDEESFYEQLFNKAQSLLQNFQAFIFDNDRRKFLKLSDWEGIERSHLWSEEFYVFLCVYRKQALQDSASANKGSAEKLNGEDDARVEYECVTYTWAGRHSPKPSFAMLTFEFQFKKVLADLIDDLSDGTMEVRYVNLQQEKESMAFLAHLNKEIVIHKGKRSIPTNSIASNQYKIDPSHVRMYHVRTDFKYKVCRAIQVSPMITSLIQRDCFVIINTCSPSDEHNYLWIGRGAMKEEEKRAMSLAQNLFKFYHERNSIESKHKIGRGLQTVKEKTETRAFWSLIAPDFTRPQSSTISVPAGQGYYYSSPPPRLFRCTTESGFFEVVDVGAVYSLTDLKSDSVCFLDAGPGLGRPYAIWVWIGKDASDVVIKLTKKTVDSYLDHQNDGRSLDRSEWDTLEKEKKDSGRQKPSLTGVSRADLFIAREGSESVEFKAFFHGWGDHYSIGVEAVKNFNLAQADVERLKDLHYNGPSAKKEPMNSFKLAQLQQS